MITLKAINYANNDNEISDLSISIGAQGLITINSLDQTDESTFLKIISNTITPQTGEYYINNHLVDYNSAPGRKKIAAHVLHVASDFKLMFEETIKRNIQSSMQIRADRGNVAYKEIIEFCGLEGLENEKVFSCPQFTITKTKLACAIVGFAPVIIFESPLAGLSEKECIFISDLLKKVSVEKTVIVTNYTNKTLVKKYIDRVITLEEGTVLKDQFTKATKVASGNVDAYDTNAEIVKMLKVPRGRAITVEDAKKLNAYIEQEHVIPYLPISQDVELIKRSTLNKMNSLTAHLDEDIYIPLIKDGKNIETSDAVENTLNRAYATLTGEETTVLTSSSEVKFSKMKVMTFAFKNILQAKGTFLLWLLFLLTSMLIFSYTSVSLQMDYGEKITNVLSEQDISQVGMSKNKLSTHERSRNELYQASIDKEEYDYLRLTYPAMNIGRVYNFNSPIQLSSYSTDYTVQATEITGLIEADDYSNFSFSIYTDSSGTPAKTEELTSLAIDEVCITDYTAMELKSDSETLVDYITGLPSINLGVNNYDVVCIIDTDYEDYLDLNHDDSSSYFENRQKLQEFYEKEKTYNRVLVPNGFYNNFSSSLINFDSVFEVYDKTPTTDFGYTSITRSIFNGTSLNAADVYLDGGTLDSGEFIIDPVTLYDYLLSSGKVVNSSDIAYLKDSLTLDVMYTNLKNDDLMDIEIELNYRDIQSGVFTKSTKVTLVGLYDSKAVVARELTDNPNMDSNYFQNTNGGIALHHTQYADVTPIDKNVINELYINLASSKTENINFFNKSEEYNYYLHHDLSSLLKSSGDLFKYREILIYIVLAVTVIIAFTLAFSLYYKSITRNKQEIYFFKSLGASKKEIRSIYSFQVFFTFVIACIVTVGGVFAVQLILSSVINSYFAVTTSIWAVSILTYIEILIFTCFTVFLSSKQSIAQLKILK